MKQLKQLQRKPRKNSEVSTERRDEVCIGISFTFSFIRYTIREYVTKRTCWSPLEHLVPFPRAYLVIVKSSSMSKSELRR